MGRPLLVIDVGNSRIKLGLFDRDEAEGGAAPLPRVRQFAVVGADDPLPLEAIADWDAASGGGAVMGGSNPRRIAALSRNWPLAPLPKPVLLEDRSALGIVADVLYPERVGLDRLLNAVAANRLRAEGEGAIIVDSGTATTIDLVDERGVFLGGAILPGLALSARALHEYTQTLPEIPLAELESCTKGPVGKETREAIRSGLFWGHLGAVRELTARYQERVPQCIRLMTGGGGALLQPELTEFTYQPHLSLQGFALSAARLLGADGDAAAD